MAADIITPDILPGTPLAEPTPQPPLIDQKIEKHYEPQTTDVTPTKVNPDDKTDTTRSETDKSASSQPGVEQTGDFTDQAPPTDGQVQTKDNTTDTDDFSENTTTDEQIDAPQAEKTSVEQNTEDTPAATSINEAENKEQVDWTDTHPQRISADWLQLSSGEWLRGRIIIMQKENLEFDSDELDDLEIEWKKVKYIKSSAPYSLRFDGGEQATGAIEITQEDVLIITDYEDQRFKRSDLLSIASGHKSEISNWTNKITFSVNVRRGNTNQTDFLSKIAAKRRTVNSRLNIDYLGTFTEIDNTSTINNHRLSSNIDIFITRNVFITPLTVEFFRDPFQNIDQRLNAGISVGYTLINTNKSEWDISGGPAMQKTNFVSVQVNQDSSDTTATLGLSTKFETELNDKVDLEGTYNVTLGDDKTGNYTHHAILTIETEITDKLDFDVTTVWDRVRRPVPDENNNEPSKDDFRILVGLGYDL